MRQLRVTIWCEGLDAAREPKAAAVYPQGIEAVLAEALGGQADFAVSTHCQGEPGFGLTEEILAQTDVLVWWSHLFDRDLPDETAGRVVERVLDGMGLLLLHSSMGSKPARTLLGRCANGGKYREVGERERVWVVDRSHPIVAGLSREYFEVERSEMYGEPYGMPTPDELVAISWYKGGEVLRSCAVWHRGAGKVCFLAPGHEEFPIYYQAEIQQVIANAVRHLAPVAAPPYTFHGEIGSIEPLD